MARKTAAQVIANRKTRRETRKALVAQRKAAHAAHRAEYHTAASHLYSMGVEPETAMGMANSVRRRISAPGLRGYAVRDLEGNEGRRRCKRYTRTSVVRALEGYRPRKPEFRAALDMITAAA